MPGTDDPETALKQRFLEGFSSGTFSALHRYRYVLGCWHCLNLLFNADPNIICDGQPLVFVGVYYRLARDLDADIG
ncbi:MAG: hypothetical protein KUG81_06080 [Gammaproteobacteria bacterium]|nr:hypothetical protein [Gammaproteobacteria bacterium]